MRIIFAIFAIACGAWLVLRDDGAAEKEAPPVGSIPGHAVDPHSPVSPNALGTQSGADSMIEAAGAPSRLEQNGAGDVDRLLRAAIERLDGYSSVAAMLRFQVRLFDRDLIGSGMYQQAGQGSERRLRFELKTHLGDRAASQVEICDGAFLWSYRENGGEPRLTRLDLRRVREVQRQVAGAPITSPIHELATGGLPKLLEQLRGNFDLLSAEEGYLGEMQVWAIDAEWKPAVLRAIAPAQNNQAASGGPFDFAKLPQLPERVTIFLGDADLIPRRIEFLRRRKSHEAEQGRGGEYTPVVTLEFTAVQFNQPIDPRQFEYQPGIAVDDVTEKFLQSRGLAPSK